MCHACSKTAHSGNRGTSDRRVFHAFCDHDDCCWTDQQKISWEMIYCTVWPLIVYHCINIIWNSLHRVSAIEQQPRVLQYLFSLLFLRQCICFCPSHCFAGFQEMDFTRQDQEEHSQQQQCFSYPCSLTTILSEPWRIQSCSSGSAILCDLFVSAGGTFQKSEVKQEYALMERMWYQQKKQYEIAKTRCR